MLRGMEANDSLDIRLSYEQHNVVQQQLHDNLDMCRLFPLVDMFVAAHSPASNLFFRHFHPNGNYIILNYCYVLIENRNIL